MSPEQWGAHPRDGQTDIDGRTDLYSLGIMFYELIAGHKPFIASSLPEIQQMHLKELPQPLHEIASDVPEAFSRAVERAMAKDRADRQASVGEFADELRTALELTVEPYSSGRLSSSNVTMPSLASAQARQPGVSTSAPGGLTTHGGAAALPANTAQASAVGAASSASSVAPVAPVVPVTPVKPRSAAPLILGI